MALHPSIQRTCAGIEEIKRAWPAHVPYAIYPSVPGLLPWGNDENGNDYYWLTNGSPDVWSVVSDEGRGEGFREYGCTMTEFLVSVLNGKIQALAGDYPTAEDRVFEPW
jgi:hypothetical protein